MAKTWLRDPVFHAGHPEGQPQLWYHITLQVSQNIVQWWHWHPSAKGSVMARISPCVMLHNLQCLSAWAGCCLTAGLAQGHGL